MKRFSLITQHLQSFLSNQPQWYLAATLLSCTLFLVALTYPTLEDPSGETNRSGYIQQLDYPDMALEPIQQNLAPMSKLPNMDRFEPLLPEPKAAETPGARPTEVRVRNGDTLSKILSTKGLSAQSIYKIQASLKQIGERSTIFPGQIISLSRDFSNRVTQISIPTSEQKNTVVDLLYADANTPISIHAANQVIPTETRVIYRSGTIQRSLFESANKAGLSDALIMKVAGLFAWEIDFILDIRQGDQFRVFYEEHWTEAEKVKDGKIIAAQFINRGKTHTGILFEDEATETYGYFEKDGSNLKKAFLRSPVDFARVSSHFNLKRRHPILHKIRAHRGVDYAAARGTPVKATGQGVVEFKGNKGGYGRTLVLKHGQRYTTLYAHLNRFHRKIRTGSKVEQGQVIGYVGSSGLATGPHLHYEFRVNKIHKNPLTVKLPAANAVPAKLMEKFKQHSARKLTLFEQFERRKFALLEP